MSYNKVMTLRQLVKSYLQYLEIEKGYSPRTIRSYRMFLERFLSWTKLPSTEAITQEAVANFRLRLARFEDPQRGPLSKKTQNYYLIALRGFLLYLTKRGHATLASDQIELAKVPERQIDFLDENEVQRLLDSPKENDLRSLRDKALLEILFSTGLRVSELCSLSRYDID